MSISSKKWIEAGYSKFCEEGPESIHVETLARELGLNKSGFYHHFINREIFFEALMDHHVEINDRFYQELLQAKKFDPDFLNLLVKYRTTFLVQAQLRRCNNMPLFEKTFYSVSRKNEVGIIPLWAEMLNMSGNNPLARELLNIFRDALFIRLYTANLDVAFLQASVYEFTSIVQALKKYGWDPDAAADSIS